MAPKKATKRAASPMKGSPSPVRGGKRARAAFEANMDRVTRTLNDEYTDACQMLASGAPSAFASSIEERHGFQDTVVALIREVLNGIKARLDTAVTEATQSATDTAEAIDRNTNAQTAAISAHEAATAAVEEQSVRLQTATADFEQAERAHTEAQDKVRACEAEKVRMQNQREKWSDCKPWTALLELDDRVKEKEVKKLNDQVAKILKGLGTEKGLMQAVAHTLSKPAAERGDFDKTTINWVTDIFEKEVARIDSELKEHEAREAECQTSANSTDAVLGSTQPVKDKEEEILSQLETVMQEKHAALKNASTQVKSSQKAHEKFGRQIHDAEQEVTEHAEVLEAFESLAARSSAPTPPPPSPVAAETAVVEA